MEAWTEVNVVPAQPLDEALVAERVDKLVHKQLVEAVAVWFYLWEPDLRLRFRWREPSRTDDNRAALAAALDGWRSDGVIDAWYEGAHGEKGETYVGEAETYGDEIWPRLQLDWMNGSELALELIKRDREGRLTKPREYHWNRRVHLFTNQLLQTWQAEIELSLRQALAYTRALGEVTPEAKHLISELNRLM